MAKHMGVDKEDRIPVADIVATIDFLLKLSPNTYIREIEIDCLKSMLRRGS